MEDGNRTPSNDSATPVQGALPLRFGVRPRRLVVFLIACAVVLSGLSLAANIMAAEQAEGAEFAVSLFSVDREGSFPSWWSVLLLAAIGGLAFVRMQQQPGLSARVRLVWCVLALGFLFLSADEACSLHERFGSQFDWEGSLHHARWVFLWLPLGLLVAGFVLVQLWRSSRQLMIGLLVGGLIFICGAVGMEMLNAQYRYYAEGGVPNLSLLPGGGSAYEAENNWRVGSMYYPYVYGTALEELLEMLGAVTWFGVMLRACRRGAESV